MKKAIIVGNESEVMSESTANCCSNVLLLHADRRIDSQKFEFTLLFLEGWGVP